jgi:NADH-quinone oxidoreductase subunit J
MTEAFFIVFSLFTISTAFGVVFSRSPVYSAFCLILSFFGLSAIYVLWGATFIAMLQILIYTGAIVVLFVFVVMLLNLTRGNSGGHSHSWMIVGISACGAWCFALLLLRTLNHAPFFNMTAPQLTTTGQMRQVSTLLFNEYLWPFEVLSLFLLALIIAIFALTKPEGREKVP